jgi:acetyl-CoA carboxylase carboxyltransferase component
MSARIDDLHRRRQESLNAGSMPRRTPAIRRQDAGPQRPEYLLDEGRSTSRSAGPKPPSSLKDDHAPTATGDHRLGHRRWSQSVRVQSGLTVFGGALGEVFEDPQGDGPGARGRGPLGRILNDGAGARIQEGVVSLASYGGIFHRNVRPPASPRRSR